MVVAVDRDMVRIKVHAGWPVVVVAVDRFVVMVRGSDISAVLGGGGSEGSDMWSVYSGSCVVAVKSVEDLAVGLRQGTRTRWQMVVDYHGGGSRVSSTPLVD